jgi:hypothetical protein
VSDERRSPSQLGGLPLCGDPRSDFPGLERNAMGGVGGGGKPLASAASSPHSFALSRSPPPKTPPWELTVEDIVTLVISLAILIFLMRWSIKKWARKT